MRSYTDQELLDRVRNLPSFKGFPKGVLDVWVRSAKDEFDKFDDKVFTYVCFGDEKPPVFIMASTGTTNAGSFGLKKFAAYNPSGCAVLKSNVLVYNSHAHGLHKGKPGYRQAKGFPYFRDNNKNDRADEIGVQFNDIIYANCHAAGVFSTFICNWSVACLVRNQKAQFDKWLAFMNKRPLSVVILSEF